MFDWDDQELANIIWDEEGKSEDHIVPYLNETYEKSRGPCGEDTKVSDKEDANVKLTKKTVSITDSQEGSSTHNERLATDRFCTLTNLSRSNLDLQHIDEKGQEHNGSQFFDAQVEDREESNFVDYGWANVGNFEDLDKILSNHDLPLWSSTKSYVTGCPDKSDLLSTDSPISRLEELKSEHDGTIHGFMNEDELKQKSASDEMEISKRAQTDEHRKTRIYQKTTCGKSEARRPHFINLHSPTPDKSQGPPSRPLSMTPQEKIEKLRRRQQMRALLAIRKQKQEFARSSNIEIDENLADSDTRPVMMDKSTLADTLLHQLENVIARLGVEIRLCIRDSLFRLAESALQRHCEGDIVSANRSRDDPTAITEERLYTTKRIMSKRRSSKRITRIPLKLGDYTITSKKNNDKIENRIDNEDESCNEGDSCNEDNGGSGEQGNKVNNGQAKEVLNGNKDVTNEPAENCQSNVSTPEPSVDTTVNIENDDKVDQQELIYIHTGINENGDEVVIFEEEMVEEDCSDVRLFKFNNAEGMNYVIDQSPWMVNGKPFVVQKWDPDVIFEKTEPCKIFIWIKLLNIPLEAWSVRDISALASRLGTPIMMDSITASMCHNGSGRAGYARILVEIDAKKGIQDQIEIVYKDALNCTKKTKFVKVEYNWEPALCVHCGVFGHSDKTSKHQVKEDAGMMKGKEQLINEVGGNNGRNDVFTEVRRPNYPKHTSGSSTSYIQNNQKGSSAKSQNLKANDKPPSLEKIWRINTEDVNELKKSANKYAVLDTEEEEQENICCDDKIKVDWNDGDSEDENDVLEVNDPAIENLIAEEIHGSINDELKQKDAVNMLRDEKLQFCAFIETHLKTKSIEKVGNRVFGNWNWCSNVQHSPTSCRIMIGWNTNMIRTMVINMRSLWKDLEGHKCFVGQHPWVLIGDFNVTLNVEEHSAAELIIQKGYIRKNDAFRFSNFTAGKGDFIDTVQNVWKQDVHGFHMYRLIKKMQNLKKPLKALSWSHGNVYDRSKSLKDELNTRQKDVDKNPFDSKAKAIDAQTLNEYIKAIKDELCLLQQKAKIQWLKEGDKNTIFFHSMIKARRNKSRVESIKDENGKIYEGRNVAEQFLMHLKKFLGESVPVKSIEDSLFINKINDDDDVKMIEEVSNEEIKNAFFDIDSNKASGPDGEINATLIALIPKMNTPNKVSDFRPTACCNVIYKCISEILTNRIKQGLKSKEYQYHFGCKELKLSHMCFADDLLVLRKGNKGSLEVIKKSLDEFSHVSSLNPNLGKNTIFFDSIKEREKHDLLEILPFKCGKLLVRYLGVPLLAKRLSVMDYKVLINKVEERINCWRNKTLSYVGRVLLLASVLSSMQIYWASVYLLPNAIGLLGRWDAVKNHVWHSIGNGEKTSMFCDKWCSNGPLSKFISKRSLYDARISDNVVVAEMLVDNDWKWPDDWLSKFPVLNSIIPPNIQKEKENWVMWVNNKDQKVKFSTNQAWLTMRDDWPKVQWHHVVWYSQFIPKHAFILWLAIQEKLPTHDRMEKWQDTSGNKLGGRVILKDIVEVISNDKSKNSIRMVVNKLLLAAIVYTLWQERNQRTFRDEYKNVKAVCKTIYEQVKSKLMTLRLKNQSNVIVGPIQSPIISESLSAKPPRATSDVFKSKTSSRKSKNYLKTYSSAGMDNS
nr:RNA-directed DNA polymerase, eukaryota, reverse transcriptase zinc-binding domain protein [Tanacetum cinerariifolium]